MRISDWSSDVCSSDLPVQRLCAADGALVRLQFPDQEPEQGRLAGAVRTDDADAVAPLHAKGEILQDRAVAAALRYILRIDDDLGLALAAFVRQPGSARQALHGTANLAHLLQLSELPLVSHPPCGHPLLTPHKSPPPSRI